MLQGALIAAPLASPFTDDGTQLSEVRLARVMRFHRQQGAGAFLAGTDAGEWWALSLSERKQLVEWCVREAGGLPVLVQATAWTTAAVLDLCQSAARHGASAAVVTPPPGIPLAQEEEEGLATSLRRYAGLPVHYLSPSLPASQPLPESSHAWKDLGTARLEQLALARGPHPLEAVVEGLVIHQGALFGAASLRQMAGEWVKYKLRLQALVKAGPGPRLAKAVLLAAGIDAGPCRPPIGGLDQQSVEALKLLVAELGLGA